MKRNIDVVRELSIQINRFNIYAEKLGLLSEIEDTDIESSVKEENEEYEGALSSVMYINASLNELTEDIRDIMESFSFDFESFNWCITKVENDKMEYTNYHESFELAVKSLENIVIDIMRGYKILNQYSYDDIAAGTVKDEARQG